MRDYIQARIQVCDNSGCWLWTTAKDKDGYGQASWVFDGVRKNVRAHRLSYLAYVGELDPNLVVMHSCNRPSCVNPAHLSQGTMKENHQFRDLCGHNKFGEKHYRSKLSDDDVDQIKTLHNSGLSQREIARQFDTHPTTIWNILHARSRNRRS